MTLPFTAAQFVDTFVRYNEAVWPMPLILTLVGVACLLALALGPSLGSRMIGAALAFLWTWSGLVYHAAFFSSVNSLAVGFAALFVVAAAVFAWHGVIREHLQFGPPPGRLRATLGFILIGYALIGYPLAALAFGHAYPAMPTFGAPCPVTIFTIGLLAFLRPPYPRAVFAVPLAWVLVASQATLLFGMYEDLGLVVAGAAGLYLALAPFSRTRLA